MDERFEYDSVYYFYDIRTKVVMGTLTSSTHTVEQIGDLVHQFANEKEVTQMMNAHDRLDRILEKLGEGGVRYDFKMQLGHEI